MENKYILIGVAILLVCNIILTIYVLEDNKEIIKNQFDIATYLINSEQTINYLNNNCEVINEDNSTIHLKCIKEIEK